MDGINHDGFWVRLEGFGEWSTTENTTGHYYCCRLREKIKADGSAASSGSVKSEG
jgi:hypothetical protein